MIVLATNYKGPYNRQHMRLYHQTVQERLARESDFSYTFPTVTTIDRFGNVANGIINAKDSPSRIATLGRYTLHGGLLKGCFIIGEDVAANGFSLEWRHLRPIEPGATFNAYSFRYDIQDEGIESFRLQAMNFDDSKPRTIQEVEMLPLTTTEKEQLFSPFMRNAIVVISVNAADLSATIASNVSR